LVEEVTRKKLVVEKKRPPEGHCEIIAALKGEAAKAQENERPS
jgi:hypothetical protein